MADFFHQVAIAYLMQKTPYVFPIIGGRKVEHLLANIEALEITLTNDHIKYLESVVQFEPGFPYWMIVSLSFLFFSFPSTHGHFTNFSRAMAKRILACSPLPQQSLKVPYSNPFVQIINIWRIYHHCKSQNGKGSKDFL